MSTKAPFSCDLRKDSVGLLGLFRGVECFFQEGGVACYMPYTSLINALFVDSAEIFKGM